MSTPKPAVRVELDPSISHGPHSPEAPGGGGSPRGAVAFFALAAVSLLLVSLFVLGRQSRSNEPEPDAEPQATSNVEPAPPAPPPTLVPEASFRQIEVLSSLHMFAGSDEQILAVRSFAAASEPIPAFISSDGEDWTTAQTLVLSEDRATDFEDALYSRLIATSDGFALIRTLVNNELGPDIDEHRERLISANGLVWRVDPDFPSIEDAQEIVPITSGQHAIVDFRSPTATLTSQVPGDGLELCEQELLQARRANVDLTSYVFEMIDAGTDAPRTLTLGRPIGAPPAALGDGTVLAIAPTQSEVELAACEQFDIAPSLGRPAALLRWSQDGAPELLDIPDAVRDDLSTLSADRVGSDVETMVILTGQHLWSVNSAGTWTELADLGERADLGFVTPDGHTVVAVVNGQALLWRLDNGTIQSITVTPFEWLPIDRILYANERFILAGQRGQILSLELDS